MPIIILSHPFQFTVEQMFKVVFVILYLLSWRFNYSSHSGLFHFMGMVVFIAYFSVPFATQLWCTFSIPSFHCLVSWETDQVVNFHWLDQTTSNKIGSIIFLYHQSYLFHRSFAYCCQSFYDWWFWRTRCKVHGFYLIRLILCDCLFFNVRLVW
jgi:hypothetical protein